MKTFTGKPKPLGLEIKKKKANFAVYSSSATKVSLGLFKKEKLLQEIPMNRTDNIWHIGVEGITEDLTYAFRAEGPHDPKKGDLFKGDAWLADPYGKSVKGLVHMETRESEEFDWQRVKSPNIPKEKLIIYEMHVRGFTKHNSSKVSKPGTFQGIIEKIPYLQELGVNCIELMPIFPFNEPHCVNVNPKTGKHLTDYWGYSSLHFFTPYSNYASSDPASEFKTLVRELHRNGIQIVIDVVFNHTGEEDDRKYYVNFRGLDNKTYYIVNQDGNYQNYTGCGNTFNCNHPVVQDLILSSMRYWVEEMHVDGFRFDLGAILNRDPSGKVLQGSPILERMAKDNVIKKVKLFAEPWDAVGTNQLGSFPKWGPWSEWNEDFRNNVRMFIKGSDNSQSPFAESFVGNRSRYKSPISTVNMITVHDGFTLRDLVSYEQKHNEENGLRNSDGIKDNRSWNCGVEGPSDDPKINHLRDKQMRNFILSLFLSQGIPLLKMGDEYGHSQRGNNNSYVQDNEISWFLWNELEKNKKMFHFVSALIEFRKTHSQFGTKEYLSTKDIQWHGTMPLKPDWNNRFVALVLKGEEDLYIAFNPSNYKFSVTLPKGKWLEVVNTEKDWNENFFTKDGPQLSQTFDIAPYSAILAKSRP